MTALSWLVPTLFYLLVAAMVVSAAAVIVARRTVNKSGNEEQIGELDILPLNSPGEARNRFAAVRSVLKSGVTGPAGALVLLGALIWIAIVILFFVGMLIIATG
ncbi:hypothetical protein [Stenotrophomonas sp. PS02289]|uniref:hypothetical protein n=1 Tax=Stenotrophomonas sp. PS02289 TaxID=2991422 RepID=UPI00249A619F|nr:hypothetical protein [Stenotrophomonas sp. PS02289]